MPRILAALLLSLFGAVCVSQNSPQLDACMNSAQTQSEMTRCASEEGARADTELKLAYKNALSSMSGDEKARAQLRTFERSFIAYRRAYVEAKCPVDNKQSCGSSFPMEADLLWAQLSRVQAKALNEIAEDYAGIQ